MHLLRRSQIQHSQHSVVSITISIELAEYLKTLLADDPTFFAEGVRHQGV